MFSITDCSAQEKTSRLADNAGLYVDDQVSQWSFFKDGIDVDDSRLCGGMNG